MSAGQWAFWVALATFIAGAGKFLDEYHIDKEAKSKARTVLVHMFLWLNDKKVRDLGAPILALARRTYAARRVRKIAIGLLFAYWATLTAFYLGRELIGPPNTESYFFYLVNWIPKDSSALYWVPLLLAIAVPALAGLTLIAWLFHKASLARHQLTAAILLMLGMAGSVSVSLLGAFLAGLVVKSGGHSAAYDYGGGYTMPVLVMASLASILIPVGFALLTVALAFCRAGLRLVQFVLLHIFNVASSPEKSPFTYVSSLLGVVILGIKVLQELASSP